MTTYPKLFFVLCISLPLGCSSKAASKGNFKDVLQSWWDKHPACESLPWTMPMTLDSRGYGFLPQIKADLDALTSAGLLTSRTENVPGRGYANPNAPAFTVTYGIGGPNKAAWTNNPLSNQPELCYSKVKVASIDNYTEPSDMMGAKVSQVAYTVKYDDLPSWARDAKVQNSLPAMKQALAKAEQQRTDILVLTANGWSKDLK